MSDSKSIKILNNISVLLLYQKLRNCRSDIDKSSGFSLIEMVAVVLMVGILAAMAVPSWLAFLSKQQLNKANDVILSSIQSAQREAKRQKFSYNVSFTTDTTGTPEYAVYQSGYYSATVLKSVLADLNTNPRQMVISSNITDASLPKSGVTTSSTVSTTTNSLTSSSSSTLTFDYTGALISPNSTGTKGLIISVKANGIQRCVIIQTLLGNLKTAKDTGCS